MPVRTSIDESLGIAVNTVEGALTQDEILAAQHRLYVELGYDPDGRVLWDVRRGRIAESMTGIDIASAVKRSEPLWDRLSGGRSAILVARESDFGMARMYEQLAAEAPRDLHVFRDHDEAIAWLLGVDMERDRWPRTR